MRWGETRRAALVRAGVGGALALLSAGCTLRPWTEVSASEAAGSTTGSSGEATGMSVTSNVASTEPTTGAATTTASGTSEGSTSDAFIGPFDLPPGSDECDGWILPIQDCPEGQKCTFGGWVDVSHCVEVVEEPKGLYEPCQILMGDWISGYDDCGPGLLCWDVDPDTGMGKCLGLCLGPIDAPTCVDPNASCTICQDCALGWCFPGCDPLLQDCSDTEVCIPNMGQFICVLDASGEEGQVFDPCEYANGCDPGLACLPPSAAEECDPMIIGCCLPFCDLSMPVCPGAGQECLPWFEMGMAPPGHEDVGICGVPG